MSCKIGWKILDRTEQVAHAIDRPPFKRSLGQLHEGYERSTDDVCPWTATTACPTVNFVKKSAREPN